MKPAETSVLLEHAVQHVLSEQGKILKRPDFAELCEPLRLLGELAAETIKVIQEGVHKAKDTQELTEKAQEIERLIDQISFKNWTPILISVSAIYERIEETLKLTPIEKRLNLKGAIDVRNHYHNLRIRLLEQLLNARMLQNIADKGIESERIWQQFFQRQLGAQFRVLQGGHIFDYEGPQAAAQMNLIIVPADANVITPGDSDGGKVHVFADQVIAAIMVASTLDEKKLRTDWASLEGIPPLYDATKDFPQLKGHAWPLCYIVARQSIALSTLVKEWKGCFAKSTTGFTPQFLLSLDSGYAFSGTTSWPCPRYPSNYKAGDEIQDEGGIYSGLGLAWLVTQIRGRLGVIQNRNLQSIARFTALLDKASLKPSTPPTWSHRFDTMFRRREIAGAVNWGAHSSFAHNHLQLSSVLIHPANAENASPFHLHLEGAPACFDFEREFKYPRWFQYPLEWKSGNLVALKEWIKPSMGGEWSSRIVVFDSTDGREILDAEIDPKCGYDEVVPALASLKEHQPTIDATVDKEQSAQ